MSEHLALIYYREWYNMVAGGDHYRAVSEMEKDDNTECEHCGSRNTARLGDERECYDCGECY